MKDARICLVTLAVDDLERAATFYDALGWTRTKAGNESVVFMQGERMVLSLFGRKDLAADVGMAVDGAAPYPNIALAINMPSEKDVDRLFEKAVAAGAASVKQPEPAFWGGYSGYFSDPDGHLWELAYNPFFKLSKRGHVDLLKSGE
ncbi:VOC family protein [Jiella sp. M17.18]|uniref:VOC family protein n=1 Tax=Jiella sp. M17.18 TaxID=3234247 RepID=UPI0034DE805F